MGVPLLNRGLLWICTITIVACEPARSSDWVLLSEDSAGRSTYFDAGSIRLRDDGVAVLRRLTGEPSAVDRVDLVQDLDCVNLRWAYISLDETLLDSIAEASLPTEGWSLLALNPADRILMDHACEGSSPARWISVLRMEAMEPGDLKEAWIDRETLTGPHQDTVRTEMEDPALSMEIFRAWSRWDYASPDSGYAMVQTEVSCDKGALRYLENSRYSPGGELVRRTRRPELWYFIFSGSFEDRAFSAFCKMGRFFQPEPIRGISPGGG